MFSSLVHYLLPVLLGIVVPRALSTNRFAVISLLRIRLGEAAGKLTSAMVLSSGILGAVDLSRLFLPQFIGYFDKAEAMSFSHSPQITYNTVKIAKKRGPSGSFQCF